MRLPPFLLAVAVLAGCATVSSPKVEPVEGAHVLRVYYNQAPFATSWGLGGPGCTARDFNRHHVDCVRTSPDGQRYKLAAEVWSQDGPGYVAAGGGKAYVERDGSWEQVRLDGEDAAQFRRELEALMVEGQWVARAEYSVGDPLAQDT